jgi:hypothetical protein
MGVRPAGILTVSKEIEAQNVAVANLGNYEISD